MAKFDSIIKFTGNLDGMVGMKGANGQTYIRKNVKPADPKTQAQVQTRTKMSLAGQLSKLIPDYAIAGLGNSRRERRNKLMKIITRNADVEGGEAVAATLAPEKLVFSEGPSLPVKVTATQITEGLKKGVKAKITPEAGATLDGAGVEEVMVVFVWSDAEARYRYVDVQIVDIDTLAGTGVDSFNLNFKCNIYTIPIFPGEGTSNNDYHQGVDRLNADGYTVVTTLSDQGIFKLGESYFAGVGQISEQ